MIIKNRTVFVYDVEVFPNVFTCCAKNTESGNFKNYEISARQNDIEDIVALFKNKSIYPCGFNNLHYDDPLINFLILHFDSIKYASYWDICSKLKELSDTIIATKDGNFASWSKYKYAHCFPSIDLLTMMFSSKLRIGLKELQVTMNYKNVQEFDGDFNSILSNNDIDLVHKYNQNDVESTSVLLERLKGDIDLRLEIEKEYGVNVINKDGVNLGMEILKTRYLKETGLTWSDIKDKKSECDSVNLKEIIFDFISFKTPELQKLLDDVKAQTIKIGDKTDFERHFLIGGVEHTFGLGGLHSVNTPETFEVGEDEVLADYDVVLNWHN